MYEPSMRVLTVLEPLQARERVTGKQLADHLEVSDHTRSASHDAVQDLGVPVEIDPQYGRYTGSNRVSRSAVDVRRRRGVWR